MVTQKHFSEARILSILHEVDNGVARSDLCERHGVSSAVLEEWLHEYSVAAKLRHLLHRKSRQLQELQEVAGLGSWELDLSTKKADWTQNEYVLLGYEDGEVDAVPANFLSRIHKDDKERALEELERPFNDVGTNYEAEFRLVMPDGTIRHVAERGKIIKDEDGKPMRYVGTTLDVTRRKEAEEEQQKLRDQLAQAQKLESIGRLAGGIAHDFNNMLQVIIGNASLARADAELTESLAGYLEGMLGAAHRSAEMTQKLLTFARKQAVSPEAIDMNATVERVLGMLRRLIGEDIELAWLPKAGLRRVWIDPAQVDQMLANLCINARDAIDGVGKITIETRVAGFDTHRTVPDLPAVAGEFVVLMVSDDGCGMDRETQAQIFEPFFTTKEVGKGTGLGLAAVFGTVEQNGGFIRVDSEPGRGTTFSTFLPVCSERGSEAGLQPVPDVEGGDGELILLVEDEVSLLQLINTMLVRLNYRVLAARLPSQAIDLAREHRSEIALLVADMVMPEMNGRELAEQLVPLCPQMRHLYMSGYTANDMGDRAAVGEGATLLQKPFSNAELAREVRRALEGWTGSLGSTTGGGSRS